MTKELAGEPEEGHSPIKRILRRHELAGNKLLTGLVVGRNRFTITIRTKGHKAKGREESGNDGTSKLGKWSTPTQL